MHEHTQSQAPIQQSSDRAFGFVMAGACAIFGAIAWWKNSEGPWSVGLWGAGAVFLLLALIWVQPLKPLNKIWLKFGELLHRIVSPLVMSVIFYLVITPIGLFMRLFGKDFLNLERQPQSNSYWIVVDDEDPPSTMNQQF